MVTPSVRNACYKDEGRVKLSFVLQELLPVRYSFVLHTKNPFSQDPNELYGEIAPGEMLHLPTEEC